MKKILLLLVLVSGIFTVRAAPIVKTEFCGKLTMSQYINALKYNDPDGIFNAPVNLIKEDNKRILNKKIQKYNWGFAPIVTDEDLYLALRALEGPTPAGFTKAAPSRYENGKIDHGFTRGPYANEGTYKYKGIDVLSDWCWNSIDGENSTPTYSEKQVTYASNGQPIEVNVNFYGDIGSGNTSSASIENPQAVKSTPAAPPVPAAPAPSSTQHVYHHYDQKPDEDQDHDHDDDDCDDDDCGKHKHKQTAWDWVDRGLLVYNAVTNTWDLLQEGGGNNGSGGSGGYGTPTGFPSTPAAPGAINGGNGGGSGGPSNPGAPGAITGWDVYDGIPFPK